MPDVESYINKNNMEIMETYDNRLTLTSTFHGA